MTTRKFDPSPPAPQISGIVLASGRSVRFRAGNKLLAPLAGRPVVERTVAAYLEAGLASVYLVVGYQGDRLRSALHGLPVEFVENPEFERGQSRSLIRGVNAISARADAAVIGVADQPLLTAEVIRRLVSTYQTSRARLVVPRYAGRRGNPVLFDRALFPELLAVTGDQGGRPVLERRPDEVVWVDVDDEEIGADLDSEEDYRRLRERFESR